MRRLAGVIVGAGLLLATPVFAGIAPGQGEIGLDFGATGYDQDTVGHTGGLLAVRGGYHFARWFELEGMIRASVHGSSDPGHSYGADIALYQYMVNGVFLFPSKSGNVVPYVLGGYGSATLDFPQSNFDDSGSAYQYGAGIRLFFGDDDHVGFRIEIARLSEDSFDETKDHNNYSVGFTWRLGTAR